jgi:hypothetical protein
MDVSGQLQTPAVLHSGKTAAGTYWIRGSLGPKFGLNAVEKRKILTLPAIEPGPSSSWPIAIKLSSLDSFVIHSSKRKRSYLIVTTFFNGSIALVVPGLFSVS